MLRVCAACLSLIFASTAAAQGMTLEAAMTRVLDSHPELQRRQAEIAATAAKRDLMALPTPWVVGAEYEAPLGSGEERGLDQGEGTLRLSRVIERGDKRSLRQAAGQARLDRAFLETELAYLELAAETVRRFTEVAGAQEWAALASERVELAQRLHERVEQRVAAARSPVAEAHSSRAEWARAQANLARREGGLDAARARLAALWDGAGTDIAAVSADLFALPAVPEPAAVRQALARNPDLQRLIAAQAVASAEAELARGQRAADITASAGAKYYGEFDSGGLMVELSVPLGSATRAAPAVRAAEERVVAAELAQASQRREVTGVALQLVAELTARERELALFDGTVIPEARAAVRQYQQGFEAGRHSFLTVADAQRRLVEARAEAIAAAVAFHRLMLELEQLTYSVEGGTR
jgi:cobalt-zinc-cadmium efflux system outer membrane protein